MSGGIRKDSLLKGTLILAGAAFVARFLGVIQRVPLVEMLGDGGMATYTIAYTVYFWLLMAATAGFPSALAKLVSEKYAVGRPEEGEAVRRVAARYAVAAGIVAAAIIFLLAPWIAKISGDPDAALAIRALAPALVLFPWIAVERGYFHGRQRMAANGLSQIWEQILRVVTAVALAYVLLELGLGIAWAAAGATFGGVLGSVGAAAVMLYWGWKLRRTDAEPAPALAAGTAEPGAEIGAAERATADVSSVRAIFRAIFRLSVPVSITALAVPTIYVIDSLITIPLLRGELGFAAAKDTLGILGGRAQSLAGLPVIFAIALSQSILPIISGAFARGDDAEVARQTSLALRMTLYSGMPVVVLLSTAVFPLNVLVFGNANGSWIIASLVVSVIFQLIMMTSGSILLGLGRAATPMKHIAVGVAVKLAGSFALAPLFGIYGIVASTAICFGVTAALNVRALRRAVDCAVLGRRAAPFGLTVALQTALGAAAAWALYTYVQPFGIPRADAAIQAAAASALALALYPALLLRTGALAAEDIAALPPRLAKLWKRAEPLLRKLRLVSQERRFG